MADNSSLGDDRGHEPKHLRARHGRRDGDMSLGGNPLTGGFNRGKTRRYRRYWCYRPACRGVKILADELEDQFVSLLEHLRPAPGDASKMLKATKRLVFDQGDVKKETQRLEAKLEEVKSEKRELLKLLIGKKISDTTLCGSRDRVQYGINSAERELRSLQSQGDIQDEFLGFVIEFLSIDMAAAWKMATPESKKRAQTSLFEGGLRNRELNPSNSSLFQHVKGSWWVRIKFGVPNVYEF